MKSKLLYTAVAFAGLAGMLPGQSFERQGPGYGYGFRERPGVTSSTVTAAQLTQWMRGATGSTTANVDKWCYAMGQLVPGGYTCPDPESFGFSGGNRTSMVDAQTFLNNLRAYQGPNAAPYAAPYAAGGGGSAAASPGLEACREAVRDRLRSNGYSDVYISSINAEDRRGGGDRVYGSADAQGQYGRHQRFDFSCGVNLERGEVRSVDLNPR